MPSILDHPLITARYFFPRAEFPPDPFMVDVGEASLSCIYARPHPGAKTLVHFHGNGEIVSDYLGPFTDSVAAIGLNLFLVEYRGYGGSTGTPLLATMLADVPKVVSALGSPVHELIFFGRSLGSFYAIHGATAFPQCAGLIVESGIADVGERLLLRVQPQELTCTRNEFDAEVRRHFDHQTKLGAYPGPVLIMHTRHDGLVDLDHAQRNYDWAVGPKTLKVFEEGNHNTIIPVNAAAYFAAIQTFVQNMDQVEDQERPS